MSDEKLTAEEKAILKADFDKLPTMADGKYSFDIPDEYIAAHPEQDFSGDKRKQHKTFDYKKVTDENQAVAAMRFKGWSLLDMVNEKLKANARANSYQAALAAYKPSEVSQDDIKERMIRDYIRLGVNEEVARKQVEALLAVQG